MREKDCGISVCMVVRDEELMLERVIKSVPYAQLIIGVDSRSKDRTMEIAKQYADDIFEFGFRDDYDMNWKKIRNQSVTFAKENWILWLDGHEIVSPDSYTYLMLIDK